MNAEMVSDAGRWPEKWEQAPRELLRISRIYRETKVVYLIKNFKNLNRLKKKRKFT